MSVARVGYTSYNKLSDWEFVEKPEKVPSVAQKNLSLIGEIFSIPLRYFGSKSWSLPGAILRAPLMLLGQPLSEGYHRTGTPLNSVEIKKYLRYASAGVSSFKNDPRWLNPFGFTLWHIRNAFKETDSLPEGVEKRPWCFFNKHTGLKINVMTDNNEVVVSFGAVFSGNSEIPAKEDQMALASRQHSSLYANFIGGIPPIYDEANQVFQTLKIHPEFRKKKILLTGQCLGGSLAQYVALKTETRAVCFNPFALGAGLQYNLGNTALQKADAYVTLISAQTDFVSDFLPLDFLDIPFSFMGLRTPGNFGKRYNIPTAYDNRGETHNYVMGSLMKLCGYDIKTKPAMMRPKDIIKSSPDPEST